jgi:hypothetical protein
MLQKIRRRTWSLMAGLVLLLLGLLWLSPSDRTLGQTVKLVYLHGALVRTSIILFAISLPVNLVGLFSKQSPWLTWGKALTWTAAIIWLGHTLFSMITTYAAWGLFIAWYEPRTRFTFMLAGVAIIVIGVAYIVADDRFSALVFALLGGITLGLLPYLGLIQHPLDPIGSSLSNAIRWFYAAIWVTALAMGGLLALWLQTSLRNHKITPQSKV